VCAVFAWIFIHIHSATYRTFTDRVNIVNMRTESGILFYMRLRSATCRPGGPSRAPRSSSAHWTSRGITRTLILHPCNQNIPQPLRLHEQYKNTIYYPFTIWWIGIQYGNYEYAENSKGRIGAIWYRIDRAGRSGKEEAVWEGVTGQTSLG
jgi:hypothetical protein